MYTIVYNDNYDYVSFEDDNKRASEESALLFETQEEALLKWNALPKNIKDSTSVVEYIRECFCE